MKEILKRPLRLELHQINERYGSGRIKNAGRIAKLATSMSANGLRVPLVVTSKGENYDLLDGYQRLAAARLCGWDEIKVEVWSCENSEALLRLLAMRQSRPWSPLEEGALIRDLIRSHGRSRRDVAKELGRNAGWVSRRLELVENLPEEAVEAVGKGEVSVWGATRIIAPLARANKEHAQKLVAWMIEEGPGTRQLEALYKHYQQATATHKERLIANPGLFIRAHAAKKQEMAAKELQAGPEGAAAQSLRQLGALMGKLGKQIRLLLANGGSETVGALSPAVERLDNQWQNLKEQLKRSNHDPKRKTGGGPGPARPEPFHPLDQQTPQDQQECGTQVSERNRTQRTPLQNKRPGPHPPAQSPCAVQGQCSKDPRNSGRAGVV